MNIDVVLVYLSDRILVVEVVKCQVSLTALYDSQEGMAGTRTKAQLQHPKRRSKIVPPRRDRAPNPGCSRSGYIHTNEHVSEIGKSNQSKPESPRGK